MRYCILQAKRNKQLWEYHVEFQVLVFDCRAHVCRALPPLLAPCMKTWGLEGHSAASWRSQPLTQTVPVLLLAEGTADLGTPQVKIKDFRHSDFEILRSEGHSRRLRTDHMATSHQNCPKAMVREFTLLSWMRSTMFQRALSFQPCLVPCTCPSC